MAKRFRVVVEYDGTDFSGWQRQVEERTVQGTLEDALKAMTGESVFVRGAGRTDAGVHADGQVATFEIGVNIPPHGLLRGLNSALPPDVALVDVAEAPSDFDARFSARGKVYRYTVWSHFVRSPLRARRAWHVREPLDVEAIRTAAAALVGDHDFRAFRASDCDRRTTRRIVRGHRRRSAGRRRHHRCGGDGLPQEHGPHPGGDADRHRPRPRPPRRRRAHAGDRRPHHRRHDRPPAGPDAYCA